MSPTHRIVAAAVLYAQDVERLAAFYTGALELKRREGTGRYVALESEAFQLVVLQAGNDARENAATAVPPSRRSNAAFKPVFFVQSIASAREAAKTLGGVVNDTSREWSFEGWTVCDALDPEGNAIQLRAPGPDITL